jgi:hypothetical protein
MGQMTVQTLLSIFITPEEYQFRLLIDDTGDRRYGYSIYRNDEVVRILEPFTRNPEYVCRVLKDFLDTVIKIGRLQRGNIIDWDDSMIEKTLEGFRDALIQENQKPPYVAYLEPSRQYEVAA